MRENFKKSHKRFNRSAFSLGTPRSQSHKEKQSKAMKKFLKNPINKLLLKKRVVKARGRRILVMHMKTGEFLYDFPAATLLYENVYKNQISYSHLINCARNFREISKLNIRVRCADVFKTEPKKQKFPRQVGCYRINEEEPFKVYSFVKGMATKFLDKIT